MTFNRKKLSILVAAASGLALLSPVSFSQDQVLEEEVYVTGFRSSLQKSLNVKRDSVNAKESIVAEDMGKMPDLNLAEAMQRVPGVAILRQGGEGRQISLRGLGADFTHVTLNGMEVPSSTAGLDSGGGTNRGRGFDFNVFSAELFNRIDINKAAEASEEEGGIAGSVNLYTMRPLDSTSTNMVVSAQAAYNDLSEKTEPRITAIYRGNNADETIGWMLSGAFTQRTSYQDGFGTVRYSSPYADGNRAFLGTDPYEDANGDLTGDPINNYWYPRLPRQDSFHHEQDRTGISAGLQFKPTDSLDFGINYVASKFENTIDSYNSFAQFRRNSGWGWPVIDVDKDSLVLKQDGDVTKVVAGTFDHVGLRTESRRNTNTTDFSQITADFEWSIQDNIVLSGMIGTASSDFFQDYFRVNIENTPAGDTTAGTTFSYDFSKDANVAAIDYHGFDTTNPANFWIMNNETIRKFGVDRQNDTARVDLEWDLSEMHQVKAGIIMNNRTVDATEQRQDVETIPDDSTLASIGKVFTYDDAGDHGSNTELDFWVLDFGKAIPMFGTENSNYSVRTGTGLNTWTVEEDTLGIYAEYNFETEIAGNPFRLNAGIRNVTTDVTATGYIGDDKNPEDNSFSNTLPALNISYNATEDMILRLGLAKTLTRPGLSSLVPSKTYSDVNRTVSGGNSQLEPLLSDDINLTWEWYFADEALVAFNYFIKDIETFISSPELPPSTLREEDKTIVAGLYPEQPEILDDDNWIYRTSSNTEGSKIDGWEIAYQQTFTELPGFWSNFGVLANYSSVDGTTVITRNDAEENAPITGMSKNSYNATLFYEVDTWGARISWNNRDDYVTRNIGSNGNYSENTTGPTQVDFTSHYNINDMWTLTFEMINLTDEYERLYTTGTTGNSNLTREYNHTGRQFFLGVRAKF
ncbi:TonB-dependent receptor [Alteromonadaceae bacterium Bs31]|nr:TonB-dependent receptor [Alteromonadaceae bacterium Bs31]